MKTLLKNLAKAVTVIIYFVILIFASTKIDTNNLMQGVKAFSGALLIAGILLIEKAYKDDNGKSAITGIELLMLSMHSLSIFHMINLLKFDFKIYLIGSAIVVAVYYLIKGIIGSIKENREYLESMSDVSEIVKKEEPIKKEAKKRENVKIEENNTKKQKVVEKKKTEEKVKTKQKKAKNKTKVEKE